MGRILEELMMKKEYINKIYKIVKKLGEKLISVQTRLGETYKIFYLEQFDVAEVEILNDTNAINPSTISVGIDFIDKQDLKKIYEKLIEE